jgi:lipopolysaccharide export system protein LptC
MKTGTSLLLFLVISTIVWWSITSDFEQQHSPFEGRDADYVEVFMNDFHLTRMDERGKPRFTLNGEHLEKYRQKDMTHVTEPVLNLLQENKWRLSASTALLDDANETVEFIDNVVMQQLETEPAVTVHTQRMMIDTRTQIAQTDSPVKVIQGDSELNSIGMIYNNQTNVLELLTRVQGYIQPEN